MNTICPSLDVPPRRGWFEESRRLSGEFQVYSPYCVLVQPKKKVILTFNLLSKRLLCVDTMLSPIRATKAIKAQSLLDLSRYFPPFPPCCNAWNIIGGTDELLLNH